jgi:hypothetical protein
LERALLWLGTEDYTGLWEAALEVRRTDPDMAPDAARRMAAEELLSLIRRGWIALYMCKEPVEKGKVTEVPPADHEQTLGDGRWWEPPQTAGGVTVRYLTTESGSGPLFDSAEPDKS